MRVTIGLISVGFLAACSAPAFDSGPESSTANTEETAEVGQELTDPPARFVAAGDTMSCAKIRGEGVKCWGGNSYGELGIGVTGGNYPAPQSIVDPGANVRAVSAASAYTCVLLKEGVVKCWGRGMFATLGTGSTEDTNAPTTAVPLPAPAREIAARALTVCARVEGGEVYCWGSNFSGALGIGPVPDQLVPTSPVDFGGRKAKKLAAGANFNCALLGNGTVRCWGENTSGQLGDGTTTNRDVPSTVVPLGAKAIDIGAGTAHACALLVSGEVSCWGNNWDGQGGIGEVTTVPGPRAPARVIGLPGPAVSLALGGEHTCVVLADHRAACFGFNPVGQIGADGWDFQYPSPVIVDVGFPVAAMNSGFMSTCALSTEGDVKCWGGNWSGELGQACYPGCTDTLGQVPSALPNIAF